MRSNMAIGTYVCYHRSTKQSLIQLVNRYLPVFPQNVSTIETCYSHRQHKLGLFFPTSGSAVTKNFRLAGSHEKVRKLQQSNPVPQSHQLTHRRSQRAKIFSWFMATTETSKTSLRLVQLRTQGVALLNSALDCIVYLHQPIRKQNSKSKGVTTVSKQKYCKS